MKRLLLAAALATVAVSAAGTAEARDNHRHDRYDQKAERDYWKDRQKAERRARKDYEKAERHYWKAVREDEKAYRRWARGQYIPVEYRQPRYYVHDYRSYGWDAPPAGYTYVRPHPQDDTYYMIELASGLVARILGD
ncbi:RcnB family protein [Luteimonas sp. MC1572]|uniref:RcnB family protein n=1 Tax=Luteimonas sp. MC1572 TaxID=2799325 RepID=UPI0018F07F68|nr:RcnB family protein [Luteimonas sp. MC1572]MBJ6980913.1 RcnB family protein [Luteimonas sp. MC1572]QQO02269.1 RcnB family protein [Luteimonas sp. MC1572]